MKKRPSKVGASIPDGQPHKRIVQFAAVPQSAHPSALPFDILAHLFAFITLRPRLRVVSLVCKRWRTAVTRSVDRLPALSHELLAKSVSLYPNLTALHFLPINSEPIPSDFPIPRNLRILICHRMPCVDRHCLLARLTSVRELTLLDPCAHAEKLLHASRTSLIRLSVPQTWFNIIPPGLYFPSLCSLDITDAVTQVNEESLAKHASQLTNLSISSILLPTELLPVKATFPQLRKLTLKSPDVTCGLAPGVTGLNSSSFLVASELSFTNLSLLQHFHPTQHAFLHTLCIHGSNISEPTPSIQLIESLSSLSCSNTLGTLKLNLVLQPGTHMPRTPILGEFPALTCLHTTFPLRVPSSVLAQLSELGVSLPISVTTGFLQHCRKLRTLSFLDELRPISPTLVRLLQLCTEVGVENVNGNWTPFAVAEKVNAEISDWMKLGRLT